VWTQIGLTSLWNDLKKERFLCFYSDIRIMCDSAAERCMKVYLFNEKRYAYFSSERLPSHADNQFTDWISSASWQPQAFSERHSEDFSDTCNERFVVFP